MAPEPPQDPLLALLLRTTAAQGMTLKQVAAHLGISYERLTQLRAQERPFTHTRRAVLERVALLLQIPVVLVLAHAQHFELRDFVWPEPASTQRRIAQALAALRVDPGVGALAPKDLESSSEPVQLFVLFLYEQLKNQTGASRRMGEWMVDVERAVQRSGAAERGRLAPEATSNLFT